MVLVEIEALLSKRIGLDAKTVSSRKIARVAEARRLACGLSDLEAYLKLLKASPQELEELVELIVVPETWFFRDRKPFEFLKQYVLGEWLPKSGQAVLRLLSVPCSTGEEPYSLAITLLEAGLSPKQFQIDAIDISKKAIDKAKRAVYNKNSFRGEDFIDRSRYFKQTEAGYELSLLVRQSVNFQQGNLLNSSTFLGKQYDIIFCRNVLIYLQSSACDQALDILNRSLVPGGLLFLGASETGKIDTEKFTSVRQPFTFAYQKAGQQKLKKVSASPVASSSKSFQVAKKLSDKPVAKTPPTQSSPQVFISQPSYPDLQEVKSLANRGQLEEALTLCKTYLSYNRMSAAAYTLLAQLYQAQGNDTQAEHYFQRALYLEPNSIEALIHLALLKESCGETRQAEILQQRIQRLRQAYQAPA
jgi:chemotaxis protein methyltransferase WspC